MSQIRNAWSSSPGITNPSLHVHVCTLSQQLWLVMPSQWLNISCASQWSLGGLFQACWLSSVGNIILYTVLVRHTNYLIQTSLAKVYPKIEGCRMYMYMYAYIYMYVHVHCTCICVQVLRAVQSFSLKLATHACALSASICLALICYMYINFLYVLTKSGGILISHIPLNDDIMSRT